MSDPREEDGDDLDATLHLDANDFERLFSVARSIDTLGHTEARSALHDLAIDYERGVSNHELCKRLVDFVRSTAAARDVVLGVLCSTAPLVAKVMLEGRKSSEVVAISSDPHYHPSEYVQRSIADAVVAYQSKPAKFFREVASEARSVLDGEDYRDVYKRIINLSKKSPRVPHVIVVMLSLAVVVLDDAMALGREEGES